ncbi:hydrolase [Microbacterium sp. SD291]|uniref:amidohydrolase family protein n=1 Tax=Microbacterium sp. SD291 TaxID=2782007 RepID=UPI001A964B4F|nr:hydrolase [Microbacterium sp. SD291]MBO0980810.1 hydrolase [Microbacterium sp. SD291]
MKAATFFDGEGWRDGILTADDDGRMLLSDDSPAVGLPRFDGVIIGGFTDHHVHLQLVDHALLAGSRLGRVVDLGANPAAIARLARHNSGETHRFSAATGDSGGFEGGTPELRTPHEARATSIEFAGAFLTPPGGYPSERSWAPAGSFRQIASPADAAAAVAEMADAGASCIKVACNSDAGPVFGDDTILAMVDAASARGLPVVAHAQGPGEAQRAARLGVDTLAHAPFTERLTDDEIAAQAASVSWISTLAIHGDADRSVAIDNVRRFHAAGGTVHYGTDMGNGPTPVDVNPHEIAALRDAGVDDTALLRALAPADPLDPASVLLVLPATTSDPLDARPLKV